MKKLFYSLALVAALVFGLTVQDAEATNKTTTRSLKICKFSYTDLAADAALSQADGTYWCDISDMNVERVVVEDNVTALTGTNVIFKVITTSDPNYTTPAGTSADPALDGSDGSTDLVSATISATGRHSKGTSVPVVGASGVGTNLGTKLGVWADTSSITDLDGYLWLVVFGRI